MGNFYNGYSWTERYNKYRELERKIASREQRPPQGPCALCGDPEGDFEYHDEDYSLPYLWTEPALYVLCRHCHRHKLHQRFSRPVLWQAFLAHVRRGGYASDLKDPTVKKEIAACCKAIKEGRKPNLPMRRPYTRMIGEEWFARLHLDRGSLTDPGARPRP